MNSQKISLNNPSFAGRIKKYDVYYERKNSARVMGNVSDVLRRQPSHATTQQRATTHMAKQSAGYTTKIVNKSTTQTQKNIPTRIESIALQTVARTHGQFNNQFEFMPEVKQVNKKHAKFQKLFYGFGIAMFLLAGAVSIHTFVMNMQAKEQIGVLGATSVDEQGVAEGTGSEPAEAPVSDQAIANYNVNPELPRYIRIPDIGVFARIKHTGVTTEGAVDAPANINDASWYNESARPGNKIGSSLLLGHVSGWSASGVFKKIDKLKPGQRFEVEKGSGEKLMYEVVRGERIPIEQVDMSKILATEVAGEHDMKLMTCSGRYDRDTDQYAERYVVYAKILR